MLSIICPFYNEKENLKELYERLQKIRPELPPCEMIFVNDGSEDGGTELLQSLLPPDPLVRILELEHRHGLTAALLAGLESSRGEFLATLDADLQNPPEEIPRLFKLLREHHADMVTGIRKKRNDSWLKKMSSLVANGIRRAVLQDHIEDIGCSLKVFKRGLLKLFYPYHGMHRFFAAIAEAEGFKVLQVPVEHEKRRFGKAKYGLWNRILGPLTDLFAVRWMLGRKIHYRILNSK